MSKFFQPYKDNSKETIEKTASFLNKKPLRQGSNQVFEAYSGYSDDYSKSDIHWSEYPEDHPIYKSGKAQENRIRASVEKERAEREAKQEEVRNNSHVVVHSKSGKALTNTLMDHRPIQLYGSKEHAQKISDKLSGQNKEPYHVMPYREWQASQGKK